MTKGQIQHGAFTIIRALLNTFFSWKNQKVISGKSESCINANDVFGVLMILKLTDQFEKAFPTKPP